MHDFDDEEQKGIRKLEIEFEQKYKGIYTLRDEYINAKRDLDADLIKQFDENWFFIDEKQVVRE